MSLNKHQSSKSPVFFIRPVETVKSEDGSKSKVQPYFSVIKKGENGYEEVMKTDCVSGKIRSIGISEEQYQGNPYNKITVSLFDEEGIYAIDLRHNVASRGLFNSLASLNGKGTVSIGIYRNKKGYLSYSVEEDGEKTSWKYTLDSLPKVEEKTIGRKKIWDSFALESFLEKELSDLNERITGKPIVVKARSGTAPAISNPALHSSKPAENNAHSAASVHKTTQKTEDREANLVHTDDCSDEDVPF